MRSLQLILFLAAGTALWAQNSNSTPSSNPPSQSPSDSKSATQRTPNLTPPRSDRVNVRDLDVGDGESSSKDTQIDISPPTDDEKTHPKSSELKSSEILTDARPGDATDGVNEMHPWDPHRAAKDIEVGDFYFKVKKNYVAAESRYREALFYKNNDALATYRLAICLEKLNRPDDAIEEYQSYLNILPHGPEAENAQKAIERLKAETSDTKATK